MGFLASATNGSAADAASGSVPWPSGLTAGDVVLLCVALGSTTPTLSTPSGFTSVRGAVVDAGTVLRTGLYTHVCTGGESGSIAFSWSGGATAWAATATAYRWVNQGTPVDSSGSNTSVTAGTSKSVTAVTSIRNALTVWFWCDSQATLAQVWTANANVTQRAVARSTAAQFLSVLTGDEGPICGTNSARASTVATSSAAFVGYEVNLAPDVSGGVVVTMGNPGSFTWTQQAIRLYAAPVPMTGQLWPRGKK